jgi:hypothetical protein
MNRSWKNFIGGLLAVLAMDTVFVSFFFLVGLIRPFPVNVLIPIVIINIGFFQFLYLVPIIISCQRQGHIEVVKGLLVSASIIVLLSSGCAMSFVLSDRLTPVHFLDLLGLFASLSIVVLAALIFYVVRRSRSK